MSTITVLLKVCFILSSALSADAACENSIECPCGATKKLFTVCVRTSRDESCQKWSRCKACEDEQDACLECPEGFEGPFCSKSTTSATCPDPGQVANAERLNMEGRSLKRVQEFPVGQSVMFKCHTGFTLRRKNIITCQSSGTWSNKKPYCIRGTQQTVGGRTATESSGLRYCKSPGRISNGRILHFPSLNERNRPIEETEEYPSRSRLQYRCNDGYTLRGTSTLICDAAGVWSANPPTCERESSGLRYCKSPGRISNGRVLHYPSINERSRPIDETEEYPSGSRLRYRCDDGYALQGSPTLICEAAGVWSANPPICEGEDNSDSSSYCNNPGPIMDGNGIYFSPEPRERNRPVVTFEEDLDAYPPGTRLVYSCDEGFQLEGADTLMCQSGGSWTGAPPVCSIECGRSFMQIERKVVRGTSLMSGEWPWVVSISFPGSDEVVCGGSLLNSRTLITAAHCLVQDDFILRFGKHYRRIADDDEEVLVRKSKRVIVNPNFNRTSLDSDIGLIIFEPRIRLSIRLQPICLPTSDSTKVNLVKGRLGNVAGWGKTEKDLPPDELLLSRLPVLTNRACEESYRRQDLPVKITKNMFCAGYENGDQSVCDGDSGSGVVFYDETTDRYTLEGLVSFGASGQCGMPGRYPVFTKVSVFLPWILQNWE